MTNILTNEIPTAGAALETNSGGGVFLAPGTYYARYEGQMFDVNGCRARLRDMIGDTELLLGQSHLRRSSDVANASPIGCKGRFTLASSGVIICEQQGLTTQATTGMGLEDGLTVGVEIYADLEIWRIR